MKGAFMKFVFKISKEDENTLQDLVKNSNVYRTRIRAHAILLSAKNYSIDDLSVIFDVHRDTVSRWIDVWGEKGIKGLYDAPKPGRPRIHKKEKETKVRPVRTNRRMLKLKTKSD